MTSHASPLDLQTLLQEEIAAIQQLLEVLAAEYQALSQKNAAGIEEAAQRKQELLVQLEPLCKKQIAYAQAAGYDAATASMESYLQASDPHGLYGLTALWGQLKDKLAQSQRQNEVNGKLILISRHMTLQALSILRGGTAAPAQGYDPQGKASTQLPTSVSLAKA